MTPIQQNLRVEYKIHKREDNCYWLMLTGKKFKHLKILPYQILHFNKFKQFALVTGQ